VVGREEHLSSLVVQHDLIVRVSGGVEDAGRSGAELYLLSLLQREYLSRERQLRPHLRRGPFGERPVHAASDQVSRERRVVGVIPDLAGVLDLTLQHVHRRPRTLLQPASEPQMVGVKVRNDDAPHVSVEIQPDLPDPALPDLPPLRVIISGIDNRPALVSLDEVNGDKHQGEGNRHLQLVDALCDLRHLPNGLRSQLRMIYAHRSASKKLEISSLASSGLS
jgi:hypothetical protein